LIEFEHVQLVPTIGVVSAWVPSVILLFFMVRLRERNAATNAILVLDVVAVITLSLALGRQFGYPPPDWVRGPAYALIAVAMWFLLISFIVIQRRGQDRDRRRLRREMERSEV
jgi:protein-S-isoprenylcysteine O-methyltransferase Ste14